MILTIINCIDKFSIQRWAYSLQSAREKLSENTADPCIAISTPSTMHFLSVIQFTHFRLSSTPEILVRILIAPRKSSFGHRESDSWCGNGQRLTTTLWILSSHDIQLLSRIFGIPHIWQQFHYNNNSYHHIHNVSFLLMCKRTLQVDTSNKMATNF